MTNRMYSGAWRRSTCIAVLLSALAAASGLQPAAAQSDAWPARPLKIIAPFPPGGTVDQLSRLFAPMLSQALGQQVIVENRPGGGGSIGTGAVAKSAPDGYTWVMVFDTHAVNPSLIPNIAFDTRRDLAPVMLIGTGSMVLVTHQSQPYRNFSELQAAARDKPDSISYGTIGSGSLAHLAMTQLNAQANFRVTHVPYKGGGPLTQDAVAGHVPVALATPALFAHHIKAGTLRPLAITSAKRDPVLPDVPTLNELGVSGFDASAWWGMLAPAGTPAPIIERMNAEMAKAVRDPKIAERLAALGVDVRASSPADMGRFVDQQIDKWAQVVKQFGIKAGD
jgi:tripartite-type tricarboxylate transporter receptor subunit TctC